MVSLGDIVKHLRALCATSSFVLLVPLINRLYTHTHTCNFVFQIKGFITLKATDFRGSFEVQ